jgi:hypothetical protein
MWRLLGLALAGFACGLAAAALADEVTMTVYYPPARGVYEELWVRGDANVGELTAPAARLHVVQDQPGDALRVDGAPGDLTPVVVDQDGNVGIGTDSPLEALHVVGNAMVIEDASVEIRFVSPAVADWRLSTAVSNQLSIGSDNGLGVWNDQILVLDASGRVGIGTSAPQDVLHVMGHLIHEDAIPEIYFADTDDADWSLISGDGHLRFQSGGVTHVTFRQTGEVGIGTDTPLGMLDVNGPIYQRGGLLHPDYVFDPASPPESIEEHAAYMWRERHLPAIGPAQTDAQGREMVEIGAHRRGMLEELEKAHIYIEQLHRRLKALEAAVEREDGDS